MRLFDIIDSVDPFFKRIGIRLQEPIPKSLGLREVLKIGDTGSLYPEGYLGYASWLRH